MIKKDTIIDDFHGTLVSDPYRWLENPNSKETIEWGKK
jgi:prolyl oligopeptidase